MMTLPKLVAVLTSASLVSGHAYISKITANGQSYQGYDVTSFPYMDNPPDVIGWSTTATDLGFVPPSQYQSADIICHEDGKPGALTATVPAGSDVQLDWTSWPSSHHGPIVSYLAPCNGDCANVDKSTLEFFKIAETGLIDNSNPPGFWAADRLRENNGAWTVNVPGDIASGNYVLRNEIIALHSAGNEGGAQNYPQCINIEVTGGGSASPQGTPAVEMYSATDPGILISIYNKITNYVIPGPAMYNA